MSLTESLISGIGDSTKVSCGNDSPPEPSEQTSRPNGLWRRWLGILTSFAIGQGSVQALNLFAGFLLIRWLSLNDYAAYSLVTGFQSIVGVLVELGLGGSIVALLAGRSDPSVIGRYIRSARHYRNRLFLILLPAIAVAFPLLARRQGWNWSPTFILLLAILVTLYFQSMATYYAIPLLVHQRLGPYYRTPAALGAVRLALYFVLQLVSLLTYVSAVFVSSITMLAQGWFYKQQSAQQVLERAAPDADINREVLGYIRPLIPSTIFFAFQGQITILLISWFGQTQSIAEVGALGRIGQLFVMLGAFNNVVIAPFIARTPRELLARRYCQVVAGALGASLALVGAAVLFPGLFLWLLGRKYEHLEAELGWMMLGACASYVTSVMWTIHNARKWIFRWCVWTYIAAVISTQIAGLVFMDLASTRNVILISVYSTAATMLVQVAWAIAGFVWERRTGAQPEQPLAT
jgi:O-antigen/teichoic acid export membrane protein